MSTTAETKRYPSWVSITKPAKKKVRLAAKYETILPKRRREERVKASAPLACPTSPQKAEFNLFLDLVKTYIGILIIVGAIAAFGALMARTNQPIVVPVENATLCIAIERNEFSGETKCLTHDLQIISGIMEPQNVSFFEKYPPLPDVQLFKRSERYFAFSPTNYTAIKVSRLEPRNAGQESRLVLSSADIHVSNCRLHPIVERCLASILMGEKCRPAANMMDIVQLDFVQLLAYYALLQNPIAMEGYLDGPVLGHHRIDQGLTLAWITATNEQNIFVNQSPYPIPSSFKRELESLAYRDRSRIMNDYCIANDRVKLFVRKYCQNQYGVHIQLPKVRLQSNSGSPFQYVSKYYGYVMC